MAESSIEWTGMVGVFVGFVSAYGLNWLQHRRTKADFYREKLERLYNVLSEARNQNYSRCSLSVGMVLQVSAIYDRYSAVNEALGAASHEVSALIRLYFPALMPALNALEESESNFMMYYLALTPGSFGDKMPGDVRDKLLNAGEEVSRQYGRLMQEAEGLAVRYRP